MSKKKIFLVVTCLLVVILIAVLLRLCKYNKIKSIVSKSVYKADKYSQLSLNTELADLNTINTYVYKDGIQYDTQNINSIGQYSYWNFITHKMYNINTIDKKIEVNDIYDTEKPFFIEMLEQITNNNNFKILNKNIIVENRDTYIIEYSLKDISSVVKYTISKNTGLLIEKEIIGNSINDYEKYNYSFENINVEEFNMDKYSDYEIIYK